MSQTSENHLKRVVWPKLSSKYGENYDFDKISKRD